MDSELVLSSYIPAVTIGVPVYNGESSIQDALDSLLNQTFTDFELIISDNASTDDTSEICKRYAKLDPRVKYVRQPYNQGASFNFKYVLEKARGKYFMWAAADDLWQPSFLEENYKVISQNPDIVTSISKVMMASIAKKPQKLVGTYPIFGHYLARLRHYLSYPGANSRFYGLHRRKQILESYVSEPFIASDWATVINLVKHGSFHEVDQLLMERSCKGVSSKLLVSQIKQFNPKNLSVAFPLGTFTIWLWKNIDLVNFLLCLDLIIKLNIYHVLIVVAEVAHLRQSQRIKNKA